MLEFRPHHFMCTLGFQGEGYSPEFVRGYHAIADRLRVRADGDEVPIRVVSRTDSICVPCPSRREDLCASETKIQTLDRAHAAAMGFREGEVLSWGQAKARIAARMTDEKFESACAPCAWKALGVCREALLAVRRTAGPVLLAVLIAGLGASAGARSARAGTGVTPEAAAPTPAPSAVAAPEGALTVDLIREQLFKLHTSKKAQAIAKAAGALKARKFAEARRLAAPLQKDELFADYGYSITASAYRAEAEELRKAKKFDAALEAARKAVALGFRIEEDFPYSPFLKHLPEDLAQAEVISGDAYHGKKQWKAAQASYERAFQRLLAAGQLGQLRPETYGRYAEACSKKNPGLLCPAWLQKFALTHPRSSEELKAIVKFFPELNEAARPARPVGKLTQAYKAPDLDQVAFDAAMATYLDGKYGDALKALEKVLDEYPKSAFRFRARYWLGQALTHEQEHEKAQKVYESLAHDSPLTYYGLLAAMACGKGIDSYIDGTLPLAVPTDPYLTPLELLRLKRSERLVVEGVNDLAMQEVREFRTRDALSSPFLMYLATLSFEAGNYNTSFSILGDLIQRGYEGVYSSYGLRLVFPVVHLDLIQKYSIQNKLDPILVLSLIKQESAFDLGAVSGAGASGLMQLMPATAVDTDPEVKRAELVDADVNIRVGTRYLRKVLTRFNGNIALALAAYNAGPNAVDRWLKDTKSKPLGMLEFIETIPYRETREYVASIIRNYFWYSRKLNGETPKTLSYFWNMYGPPELPTDLPTVNEVLNRAEPGRKTAVQIAAPAR